MITLADVIFDHYALFIAALIVLGMIAPGAISYTYFWRRYRPFIDPNESDDPRPALEAIVREAKQDLFWARFNLTSWVILFALSGVTLLYSLILQDRGELRVDTESIFLLAIPLFSRWLLGMDTVDSKSAKLARDIQDIRVEHLTGEGDTLSGEIYIDGNPVTAYGEWMRTAHRRNGDLARTPGAALDILYPKDMRELYGDIPYGRRVPVWLGYSFSRNRWHFVAFDGVNSYLTGTEESPQRAEVNSSDIS